MHHTADDWRDRSVLVLGATGFLGSWLTRELVSRHAHVTALVREHARPIYPLTPALVRQVHWLRGDRNHSSRMKQAIATSGAEIVFDCTAQGPQSAADTHSLQYADRVPVVLPLRAEQRITPRTQVTENTWSGMAHLVRLPSLFGPGNDHPDRLLPILFRSAVQGLTLPRLSAGESARPVCSVSTAVEAILDSLATSLVAAPSYDSPQTHVVPAQGTMADVHAILSQHGQPGPRLHAVSMTSGVSSLLTQDVLTTLDWYSARDHAPSQKVRWNAAA